MNGEGKLTKRSANGVENQKPDPSLPADVWIGNGDRSSKDGKKGHEPLSRDAKGESNRTVPERYNYGSISVL